MVRLCLATAWDHRQQRHRRRGAVLGSDWRILVAITRADFQNAMMPGGDMPRLDGAGNFIVNIASIISNGGKAIQQRRSWA